MSKQIELIETLDQLKSILGQLVEVAQREQRHLIAFEPDALQGCNYERAELLEIQAELEARIREEMASLREGLGVAEEQAPTLVRLARFISGNIQSEIEARCQCIEALAGTLRELHAMNALHAERGLQTVRGYLQTLTGAAVARRSGTYNSTGRKRSGIEGLATVQGAL